MNALAKAIGKHPSHVRYWTDGQQLPSLIDAFKIEKETGGAVTVESWMGTDLAKLLWNTNTVDRHAS